MKSVEQPIRECYTLLSTIESLPPPVKSRRHPLLIVLGYAIRLLQEIILDVDSLQDIYGAQSRHRANLRRQYIVEQLDELIQSKDDILHNIDSLLLNAKPE